MLVRLHSWVNTHTQTHTQRERASFAQLSHSNHPEALILHSRNTVDTYFYHSLFIYLCFIALSNKSSDFIILCPLSTSHNSHFHSSDQRTCASTAQHCHLSEVFSTAVCDWSIRKSPSNKLVFVCSDSHCI